MCPRTLVVHTGGVGDFIVALPALEQLATEGPLELAGRRERLQLAVDAGIAEAAHDLDSISFDSLFSGPAVRLKDFSRRFERAIVWMRDEDGLIEQRLRTIGVRDVHVFPGLPPADWDRHASAYYANCLDVADQPDWRLRIHPAGTADKAIVFHPGSGGKGKNWPMDRFTRTAQALEVQGSDVWWSLGPAEENVRMPKALQVLPSRSLSDLARLLAGAALYLGNDSGITHLAAAVGCPTVAIFGPTNPRVWAPRGEHVRVVRGNPWPEVEAVVAAVADLRAAR